MVRPARRSTLAALCAFCLITAADPSRAQDSSPDSAARAVQKIFAGWIDSTTPGCAVGVDRRGQPAYRGTFGMANLETGTPITLNTVFQAASIAKQFTAMSVLMLVRDGKLSLDDDVRKYIPELPDYGSRIALRNLLNHTSGLRDFFEMLILARGRFEEDRISHADMMDIVTRQKSLNFKPGEEFLYSNTGYALLEVIVSRVAGKSLRDFAAERIFAPLGMKNTRFKDDYTALVPGRATGYGKTGDNWKLSFPNYDVYGSTNLFTTVGDLLIWNANLDNPRVGDSAMVRQMSTSGVLTNGDPIDYGFGLGIWKDRGSTVIEHEGGDPGFHSYIARYLPDHLSIVVLCNAPSNPVYLGHTIADIYRDPIRTPGRAAVATAATIDNRELAKREGVYFQPTTLEVVEITLRDSALFTRKRGGRRLIPIDANRFRLAGREVEYDFGAAPRSGFVAHPLIPGRHQVSYQWKAPVVATQRLLAQYAGKYFSEELNTTYRVTASDSTLLLKTGTSEALIARPVFADSFAIGQLTVQFTRDRAGRVSGFEISHPRARRLKFVRTGSARPLPAREAISHP